MTDFLKKFGKVFLTALMWLFIFSIRIDGRTLFSHGHGVFVDNTIVKSLDESLADMWYRLKETAKVTFSKQRLGEKKA